MKSSKLIILLLLFPLILTACKNIDNIDNTGDNGTEEATNVEVSEYLISDEIIVYDEDEFKESEIKVELDGEILRYNPKYNNDIDGEVKVIIFRQRSLVPLRELAEKLGYEIEWEGAGKKQVLKITGNGRIITTKLNSNEFIITKDGVTTKLLTETPNVKYDSKIYVPVRFMGEAFGLEVEWLEKEFKVELRTKKE